MSFASAPSGAHRIDVTDQTGRAYRAVLDNIQLAAEMALIPFVIVFACEFAPVLLPGGEAAGQVSAALIEAAGFLIFGSVFVVRWQRFVLLGESVSTAPVPPGWVPFFVSGVTLFAVLFAGWAVLVIIVVLPPHILTMTLTGVGGIALTLFSIRVSLIFPAAAAGRLVGMHTAWGWVSGNFWRLFVCLILCYMPFVIANSAIAAIAAISPLTLRIVFAALSLAVSFAGIAVVAALLAQLYRELAPDPEPSTG